MSLREKAREIKAAGEAERGDFTPSGAPLRVYQYWAARSKNTPRTENFCHFWRVVVLWAPLMAFKESVANIAENILNSTQALVVLALVSLAGIVYLGFTFETLGASLLLMLGITYALTGLVAGAVYALEKSASENWQPDNYWFETEEDRPQVSEGLRLAVRLTSLVSWLSYSVVQIGRRVDRQTRGTISAIILSLCVVVFAVGGLVLAFLEVGWWLLFWLLAGVAAIALAITVIIFLGKTAESVRAYWDSRPVQEKPEREFDVTVAIREPGRISKFFSGVADFLILAAQIARVKKWKICPIVTIPKERVE